MAKRTDEEQYTINKSELKRCQRYAHYSTHYVAAQFLQAQFLQALKVPYVLTP